jgi:AraC-like DNA-binding protein
MALSNALDVVRRYFWNRSLAGGTSFPFIEKRSISSPHDNLWRRSRRRRKKQEGLLMRRQTPCSLAVPVEEEGTPITTVRLRTVEEGLPSVEPDELPPHEWEAFLANLKRVIEATMGRGTSSLAETATTVGVSGRTLQRRLASRGTSFRRLVDGVRHDRAIAFLTRSNATVEEIAAVLGFRTKRSFHRAFRRWTGTTPRGINA